MSNWTCPTCGRTFGRNNQAHMCAPGLSVEEFFATAHERERPIFDAVMDRLDTLGPVVVEPVQIGILLKNGPVFAELRTMKNWVATTFKLPVKLDHPRLSRKVQSAGTSGHSYYHVVNVADASEVDDTLLDWLTEAYLATEI